MRQLFRQLNMLMAAMLLLASNLAFAIEVEELYVADVSAEQSQRQWQHNALAQVITRLTGLSDFSAYPAITSELNNASRYVKQFESKRQNGDNRLKVLLDASKINPLLQQQGLAIWGAHRPEILIWIVQQQAKERRFLRHAEDERVQMLLQNLKQNGIPVTVPLYDMDDLLQVSETDVWAGFWQPVTRASARYRPDMVMTVALDQIAQDGTTVERLSWQRQSPVPGSNQTRIVRNEVTASDFADLTRLFSETLTRELAAEQAVALQDNTRRYQLAVENVTTLADVLMIERILARVLGVSAVTLNQFSSDQARFALELQIDLAQLNQILRWEPALTLKDNATTRWSDRTEQRTSSADAISFGESADKADANYIFIRR